MRKSNTRRFTLSSGRKMMFDEFIIKRYYEIPLFTSKFAQKFKTGKVLVYLWCHCWWVRWAGARCDWSAWIAAGCVPADAHCRRSRRKGWKDSAPHPWRGPSLNLNPRLNRAGKMRNRHKCKTVHWKHSPWMHWRWFIFYKEKSPEVERVCHTNRWCWIPALRNVLHVSLHRHTWFKRTAH